MLLAAAVGLGGTATAGGAAAATGTARAGSGEPVPGPAELKAALLTSADTGLRGSTSSGGGGGGGGGISGCAALEKVLVAPGGPRSQEADFSGGQTGPLLSEELTSAPSARQTAVFTQTKKALASCHKLTLTGGSTRLTLTLQPIRFGGAESTAARMDGKLSGVQVNGYLAFGHVGPVLINYSFFQFGNGSSQLASGLYQKAVDKVRHVVAGGGGTPV
ncbi:hypothetical protein [Actinacidiphila yanglinensis]|uniref:hypothetical protein n=1 Tax=Actinacidiphila yanglinensis TaxID=310779 RepID=UPI000CDEDB9B|nr:hypothetical protein [Actinacidiphila yanglinensis]